MTTFLRSGLFPIAQPTISINSLSRMFRTTPSRRSSRSRNRSWRLPRMARSRLLAESLTGRRRETPIECRAAAGVVR